MGEIQKDELYSKDVLRRKSEAGTEDTHYPLFYTELPDKYKLLAEEKLNETDENKEKGLRKLKKFLQKENLLCTDNELLMVLRCCKYNFKKAEVKLRKYLKCRWNVIEKLCQLDEDKIEPILDDLMFSALPYRDHQGRAVFLTKPSLNLDVYSMNDIEPIALSFVLYLLQFPLTQVCGMSYIAESKCDSILIFYPIIKAFRTYILYIIDLPLRAGRCDILNENFIVRFFFNAIRPVLPDKLYKRIFLNGDTYENLHKIYHPDILPEEFEGNMAPINDKFYRERLLSFMKQLKAEGMRANASDDWSSQL